MSLLTAPVDWAEAKEFIRAFHYLGTLPASVRLNFAARIGGEDAQIEAVACYGPCHAPRLPPGMLELRRLAKRPGSLIALSQFLAATLRALHRAGYAGVLTWADPAAGHHGGIYQATNWVYNEPGSYNWNYHFRDEAGKVVDHRAAFKRFGTSSKARVLEKNPMWEAFLPPMKLRYLYPLAGDKDAILAAMNARALPYPKPAINGHGPKRIAAKFRPPRATA